MDHLAQPLEALQARAAAFGADDRARLLYVPADPDLAEAALRIAVSQEWHPDNTRPFLVLASSSWHARCHELRAEYARHATAYDAITFPELPPPADGDPLAGFAQQLQS